MYPVWRIGCSKNFPERSGKKSPEKENSKKIKMFKKIILRNRSSQEVE